MEYRYELRDLERLKALAASEAHALVAKHLELALEHTRVTLEQERDPVQAAEIRGRIYALRHIAIPAPQELLRQAREYLEAHGGLDADSG